MAIINLDLTTAAVEEVIADQVHTLAIVAVGDSGSVKLTMSMKLVGDIPSAPTGFLCPTYFVIKRNKLDMASTREFNFSEPLAAIEAFNLAVREL